MTNAPQPFRKGGRPRRADVGRPGDRRGGPADDRADAAGRAASAGHFAGAELDDDTTALLRSGHPAPVEPDLGTTELPWAGHVSSAGAAESVLPAAGTPGFSTPEVDQPGHPAVGSLPNYPAGGPLPAGEAAQTFRSAGPGGGPVPAGEAEPSVRPADPGGGPLPAAEAAQLFRSAGRALAAERAGAGEAVAAASGGRPWGRDEIGTAFERRYRPVETQLLVAWEQLAVFMERLGDAAARGERQ